MMRWIVGSSLKSRGLVVALAAVVLFLGVTQLREMPRDVLPEFARPTVEVQTEALGLSAPEVEQLITVPLEQDLLNGVPWLDQIHSEVGSRPVLDRADLRARHRPRPGPAGGERAPDAGGRAPARVEAAADDAAAVVDEPGHDDRSLVEDASLIDMGVLARWTIRPRLMGVPGVANVAIWGQRERQLQVQVDPERLRRARRHARPGDQHHRATRCGCRRSVCLEATTPGTGGFIDGPQPAARDPPQVADHDAGGPGPGADRGHRVAPRARR